MRKRRSIYSSYLIHQPCIPTTLMTASIASVIVRLGANSGVWAMTSNTLFLAFSGLITAAVANSATCRLDTTPPESESGV
mmetsp:Transcript_31207/g.76127  ORF Transcript_31207/g.76127 Transcript_31207/m.76127 type:complete len:80 (+) Transcript_31207:129-368(+)